MACNNGVVFGEVIASVGFDEDASSLKSTEPPGGSSGLCSC